MSALFTDQRTYFTKANSYFTINVLMSQNMACLAIVCTVSSIFSVLGT